jgi:hypothetical protein
MLFLMVCGVGFASSIYTGESISGFGPNASLSYLLVAASDSRSSVKAGADYVCDGTADEVTIQEAIDEFFDDGGTVLLASGTYIFAGDIVFNYHKSNIRFLGSGEGNTIISGDPGGSSGFIQLNTTTGQTLENLIFSDFSIDATSITSSGAGNFISNGVGGTIDGITIQRIKMSGVDEAGHKGVEFTDADVTHENIRIEDCHITSEGFASYGVLMKNASKVWVQDNYVEVVGQDAYNGISLYGDTEEFHVNNNHIESSGHSGIAISPAHYGEIIGNYVNAAATDETLSGIGVGVEAGIEIEWKESHDGASTSDKVVVSGNTVNAIVSPTGTNAQQHGILIINRDALTGNGPPSQIVLNGNTISNIANHGIYIHDGIGINVSGNIITSAGGYGILADGVTANPVTGLVLNGNQCIGSGIDGIRCSATESTLTGNRIDGSGGIGIHIVDNLAANLTTIENVAIVSNTVTGSTSDGIKLSGFGLTMRHVMANSNISDNNTGFDLRTTSVLDYYTLIGNIAALSDTATGVNKVVADNLTPSL